MGCEGLSLSLCNTLISSHFSSLLQTHAAYTADVCLTLPVITFNALPPPVKPCVPSWLSSHPFIPSVSNTWDSHYSSNSASSLTPPTGISTLKPKHRWLTSFKSQPEKQLVGVISPKSLYESPEIPSVLLHLSPHSAFLYA